MYFYLSLKINIILRIVIDGYFTIILVYRLFSDTISYTVSNEMIKILPK